MGVIHGRARGRRGEALQGAWCTTTMPAGEWVRQWSCAKRLPLTSFRVSDSPRHQFIYTSADASRPCRNGGSLVISTQRFARVQRVFYLYPAYLLAELRFLRHGRLRSAYM